MLALEIEHADEHERSCCIRLHSETSPLEAAKMHSAPLNYRRKNVIQVWNCIDCVN